VERALAADVDTLRRARQVDVLAAGKAAAAMLDSFVRHAPVEPRLRLGIGPPRSGAAPAAAGVEWHDGGHPLPDRGSLRGAERALAVARGCGSDDLLVVLLSGGGSALMALPAEGLTLEAKQRTARTLMERGADIYELNTVRKHLSAIKGGRLAAAAGGAVLTLAVSDVVGDDLSVIASGPTVPDDSTFAAALDVLERRGGLPAYPGEVVAHLRRGVAGAIADTPASGDARLARARARVIGPQRGAIEGARRAAETLGYQVRVVAEPVTGEARVAGPAHAERTATMLAGLSRPACVIASGETTVTVTGRGRGGRNQEFALGMAGALGALGADVVAASVGTDGVDGPTDAAGAVVDPSTLARAADAGLDPGRALEDNDTYTFFDRLGDLIRTGPTSTNVGDLQVILVGK